MEKPVKYPPYVYRQIEKPFAQKCALSVALNGDFLVKREKGIVILENRKLIYLIESQAQQLGMQDPNYIHYYDDFWAGAMWMHYALRSHLGMTKHRIPTITTSHIQRHFDRKDQIIFPRQIQHPYSFEVKFMQKREPYLGEEFSNLAFMRLLPPIVLAGASELYSVVHIALTHPIQRMN